jgi:hypothetical protein
MKQFVKYSLTLAIAASGFIFAACEGEDGDPGAAGAQGDKGTKGDTGAEGENGIGFDEALQYGNIVMQLKGTRTDGVAFDEMIDFKFCPPGPDAIEASEVQQNESGSLSFSLARFNAVRVSDNSDYGTNSAVALYLNKSENDEESSLVIVLSVGIISDDAKFFRIYNDYSYPISEENLTDYSFNSVTSELKFKFHGVFPADENDTNHDLEVTANVNVKVLQNLVSPK